MIPNPTPEQLKAVERYHEEIKLLCQQINEKAAIKKENERLEKLNKQSRKK